MSRLKLARPKQSIRYYRHEFSRHSIGIFALQNEGYQTLVDCARARLINSRQHVELALALTDLPHPWQVTVSLLGTENGLQVIESREFDAPHPMLLTDLEDGIQATYQMLINEHPDMSLINTGWLATPYQRSPSPEQLDRLYDLFAAWQSKPNPAHQAA